MIGLFEKRDGAMRRWNDSCAKSQVKVGLARLLSNSVRKVVTSEHRRRTGHSNGLSAPLYLQTNLTPPMKSVYHGPYTRLLYNLFGIEGPFQIIPHYHIPQTSRYENDVVALFTVELDEHPVLFIVVKSPAFFHSQHRQAGNQI